MLVGSSCVVELCLIVYSLQACVVAVDCIAVCRIVVCSLSLSPVLFRWLRGLRLCTMISWGSGVWRVLFGLGACGVVFLLPPRRFLGLCVIFVRCGIVVVLCLCCVFVLSLGSLLARRLVLRCVSFCLCGAVVICPVRVFCVWWAGLLGVV